MSQPIIARLSFGDRTFEFEATHNAAAAAVSLGIAWMHGIMQEAGGPKPGQELVDDGNHQDPRTPRG